MSKISKLCLTIALVIVLLITPVAAMAQTIEPVDPNGGGSIIVYIALDVDGNGKVGEGDPLVAGAKVNVGHGTNCDDVATAYQTLSFTTNSDGRFDINDATDCYFLSVVDAVERYDGSIPAPKEGVATVVYVKYDAYRSYIPSALKQ